MSRNRCILMVFACAALAAPRSLRAADAPGARPAGDGAALELAQSAATQEKPAGAAAQTEKNPLLDPKSEAMNKTAPAVFKVKFETSKGNFVMEVHRDWAPKGADRFFNLVNGGFYDGCRFFRVVKGFMAQVGIQGDPKVMSPWRNANIVDDPVKQSNTRGFVTYAKTGAPNSRSTQIFINYKDNSRLDSMGFAPFAKVSEGMEIVDALHSDYGDGPPSGTGPDQSQIQARGNSYLQAEFPKLDYIKTARVVTETAKSR